MAHNPQPSNTAERLQQLEEYERQITAAIQYAASALGDLSRDKANLKTIEGNTTQFLKTLEGVENGLSRHIIYLAQVSASQPHEGSSYAAQKDLQMAFHRLEHVRSRLTELERMKADQRLRYPQTSVLPTRPIIPTGDSQPSGPS